MPLSGLASGHTYRIAAAIQSEPRYTNANMPTSKSNTPRAIRARTSRMEQPSLIIAGQFDQTFTDQR